MKYPNIRYNCCKCCPSLGIAMYVDISATSSRMSTLPSSTAHRSTPINSWYSWIRGSLPIRAYSLKVTECSTWTAVGGLVLQGPPRHSLPTLKHTSRLTAIVQHSASHITIFSNCAPRYISGGSILSSFNLKTDVESVNVAFGSSDIHNMSST